MSNGCSYLIRTKALLKYRRMNKIPYKARLGIGIGLFLWAIVAFIVSIVYYVNTLQLWVMIVVPIIAFISFIASIVFFPRFKPDGTPTVEPKPKTQKAKQYKPKKQKEPFISDEQWKELDEEDEECMYIDEDD